MAATQRTIAQLNATSVVLDALFQTSYQASIKDTNNWVQPFIKEVSTVKKAVNWIFYGDMGDPDEVGEGQSPVYQSLLGYEWELGMNRYQNGVRIRAEDYEDDELGLLNGQVMKLAQKYAAIYRVLVADILNNGATSAYLTYDGANLYDNTHTVGLGSFDNLLAGTGAFATDLQTAYTAMADFVDDKNQKRDDNFMTNAVIPTGLKFAAATALESTAAIEDDKNSNVINVTQGLVTAIVEPRLTDVNDWFGILNNSTQPAFVAIRHSTLDLMRLIADNDVNSDGFKNHEEYRWWIRARKSVNPIHPHQHLKVVNA